MAYWIQQTVSSRNVYNCKLYYCDYLTDINKLPRFGIEGETQDDDSTASDPCAYGSKCVCLEDGGSRWILSKDTNEWCKISGEGGDINIASDEEVDDMLADVFEETEDTDMI